MDEGKLLTKAGLAEKLGVKVRGVECFVASGKIPVIRLSRKCVRFRWPDVERAIRRFEIKEIGARK